MKNKVRYTILTTGLTMSLCFLMVQTAYSQNAPLVADSGFAAPALANCKTDLRYLNQVGGWQASWPTQWERLAENSDAKSAEILRWEDVPKALVLAQNTLRNGITNEETAPRVVVLRISQQLHDLTAALTRHDPKYFAGGQTDSAARWNLLLSETIIPAVVQFTKFLDDEYLPAARTTPGLLDIEGGKDCFSDAAEWWTTLRLSQEEIETIGERLMHDTRNQLMATADNNETFSDIMTRLRASQKIDGTTSAELIKMSEIALARADKKIGAMFSKQASTELRIVELPEHMQASFPAGRYTPSEGDNEPAAYVINPSRPGERRLMAEVIAFHEGLPGHHLFLAYPRETPSSGYNSGILEGWAIYAEFVADEMGLYSSPYDRQGMITKHLWATSRLIVEPGLHLRGWSREDAITFMLDNTVMSRTEIEIEVDRYIAMPGQSLSYMLGADLIMSEREQAKEIMGDAFDIKDFHDVVLIPGVRSLPDLRADIRKWSGAE